MKNSLAKKLSKALQKNGSTISGIMSENEFAEIPYYVDSGVVGVNLLLSAKWDGGTPAGRVTMFAGPKSSGKTLLAMNTAKNFQKDFDGTPVLFDSEFASDSKSLESSGIDTDNLVYLPICNIKDEDKESSLSYQTNELANAVEKGDKALFIYDSMGEWQSQRTVANIEKNNTAKDMSITQEKKAFMSQILQISGKLSVPSIVINHSYANLGGFGSATEVSGGGALYKPSQIIEITSKANWKDEDTKERIGSIFTAKVYKGRLARENAVYKFAISYENGLSRYYGMHEFALEGGYIEEAKDGRSTVYKIKDTDLVIRKKNIYVNPETEEEFWKYLFTNTDFGYFLNDSFAYGSSKKLKSLVIEDEEK